MSSQNSYLTPITQSQLEKLTSSILTRYPLESIFGHPSGFGIDIISSRLPSPSNSCGGSGGEGAGVVSSIGTTGYASGSRILAASNGTSSNESSLLSEEDDLSDHTVLLTKIYDDPTTILIGYKNESTFQVKDVVEWSLYLHKSGGVNLFYTVDTGKETSLRTTWKVESTLTNTQDVVSVVVFNSLYETQVFDNFKQLIKSVSVNSLVAA